MIQREPDLFDQARHAALDDVLWFEKVLLDSKEWMSAVEILNLIGRRPGDDGKRWVRDLASRSKWILSGPGSPGYKHIRNSTPEEIAHYKNSLISQGKDMIQRAIKISRSAHEVFG